MIAHNQPSLVSNITTTDQVDTDVNNDGYTNYFANPREKNHCTPEINDTNPTNTQVQPNLNPRLLEWSHSRRVPAQDGLFALILWYVANILY